MKKIILILSLVLFACTAQAQSKKQIKEAFTRSKSVKAIVFYCQDRAQFERKRDRVLKILFKMGIEYGIKIKYKYSDYYHFKINY